MQPTVDAPLTRNIGPVLPQAYMAMREARQRRISDTSSAAGPTPSGGPSRRHTESGGALDAVEEGEGEGEGQRTGRSRRSAKSTGRSEGRKGKARRARGEEAEVEVTAEVGVAGNAVPVLPAVVPVGCGLEVVWGICAGRWPGIDWLTAAARLYTGPVAGHNLLLKQVPMCCHWNASCCCNAAEYRTAYLVRLAQGRSTESVADGAPNTHTRTRAHTHRSSRPWSRRRVRSWWHVPWPP